MDIPLDFFDRSNMMARIRRTAGRGAMKKSLVEELNELHAAYVVAVNEAIADGELAAAEQLAANYDKDAIELVADREGKQHLLPLPRRPESLGIRVPLQFA
jgi:hypothetical protein